MFRRLDQFLFHQPDPRRQAAAIRMNLVAVISLTVAKLPPGDFFEEHRDTVAALAGDEQRRMLTAKEYETLRATTVASLAAWGATGRRAAGLTAAAQFARLSQHVTTLHPKLWSYNSHLNVFLAVLGALDTSSDLALGRRAGRPSDPRLQSLAIAFMQLYVGMLYFQSAVSKLKYGGVSWLSTGRTLRAATALTGTGLGHRLYERKELFRYISIATVALEVLFLPLLLVGKPDRRLVALAAAGFHIGAAATTKIPFWHLWTLYPTLFWLPERRERGRRAA
ncbi:hypothetical protein [Micromonospora maritima]|uniref:hypothetical protein n=1 Tax=Micromonospora maritima TaxID=986711 RepID=UPI00157D6508|nr:hypothetical protein [Micromonospora maritima]